MRVNRIAEFLTHEPDDMPRREMPAKSKFGTYLPDDLIAILQDYSEDSGVPITKIVEKALRAYLTKEYRSGHRSEDDGPDKRRKK